MIVSGIYIMIFEPFEIGLTNLNMYLEMISQM